MNLMLFANNATSRLWGPIDAVTTSIRVEAGDGDEFPQPPAGDYFTVTVEDRRTGQIEIMRGTGRSGDILNVVRGQEGTTPQAFALGATVSNRLTAGTMNYLIAATGVSEVPNDGQDYARHYGAWVVTINKVTFDTTVSNANAKNAAQDLLIAGNTADIATNTTNIATNAANIAINAGHIATNTADIDAVEAVNTAQDAAIATKVNRSGDSMGGPLTVPTPPTSPGHAASKAYVDSVTGGMSQFPEAPNDGKYYGRHSLSWGKVTEEAPSDGLGYSRKNGAWAVSVGGAYTDDSPPGPPLIDGQLWWDSTNGILYVYYQDVDGYQWVQTNGGGTGGAVIYTDDLPPSNPIDGMMWWRSDIGQLMVYYDDGNTMQWVQASVAAAPVDPYKFTVANMRLYSKSAGNIALNSKADGTGTDVLTIDNVGTITTSGNVTAIGNVNATGNIAATGTVTGSTVNSNQNFNSLTTAAILAATGAGTVYLRPNGVGSGTGQMSLDNAGNVTVNGVITVTNQVRAQAGVVATGAGIQYNSYSSSWFRFGWSSNSFLVQVDGGNIGGSVVPYSLATDSALTAWGLHGANGNIYCNYSGGQVNWAIVWSDRRLKSNIRKAGKDALAMLNRLTVHELDYMPPLPNATTQHLDYSLIADEVGAVYPAAFVAAYDTYDDDGTVHPGYDSILDQPMISALVKAVQQLTARVEALEGLLKS